MNWTLFKKIRKEQVLLVLYTVVIFAGLLKVYVTESVPTFMMPTDKKVIMLDAGHGGWDPGKIGFGDVVEKDINLAITKKVQRNLELSGAFVVTTRLTDTALADGKRRDLDARRNLSNNLSADIIVSIHQNSYPSPNVKGAQVFYYDNSEKSKRLAECIQNKIVEFIDPGNKRGSKENGSYYMLKKTTVPAVIVECGFLSNYSEGKKLSKDEYQEKIAWAIYMGIVDYYDEKVEI